MGARFQGRWLGRAVGLEGWS